MIEARYDISKQGDNVDIAYAKLCLNILAFGQVHRENRTEVATYSSFGHHMQIDMVEGFPLLTTKKLHWKSIVHELLWMISGSQNIDYLKANGITIWDEWATPFGYVGPMYGYQWRKWSARLPVDQLQNVIDAIKVDPWSRRLVVNAWNAADLPHMALMPCHVMYQFYVRPTGQLVHSHVDPKCSKLLNFNALDCQVYMRSADVFLGLPFNIASYALLTHLVAHLTGLVPGTLKVVIGDAHIYENHLDQVLTQLGREPMPLPQVKIDDPGKERKIDDFRYEHIHLIDYCSHGTLKGKVAV